MTLSLITEGVLGGGAVTDVTPPTVTIVSPTPGAAPGSPGGFPADPVAANATPIVVDVTDLSPGLLYFMVYVNIDGEESVVFRANQFRGKFITGSSIATISNGFRLTVLRAGGWGGFSSIKFGVDAVDAAGNITS